MKRGVLALCLCFCLASCTKSEIKEIDMPELSQRVYLTEAFDEELIMHTDEEAKKITGLTDFDMDEILLYTGSGALSDKILLIKADKSSIKEITEILKKENESLQKSYASYNPQEVPKLENAVLKALNDNTLIYCVSRDSELIEKELDAYMKGK